MVVNAGHFFVSLSTHPTFFKLEEHEFKLNYHYNSHDAPRLPTLQENLVCVAFYEGFWHRVYIKKTYPEQAMCDIVFADVGGYASVKSDTLRQIAVEFISLPFQALSCSLKDVKPSNGVLIFLVFSFLTLFFRY